MLEDAARRAFVAAACLQRAALGMGHQVQGGLGTVLGWLVGWCGSALGGLERDRVQ